MYEMYEYGSALGAEAYAEGHADVKTDASVDASLPPLTDAARVAEVQHTAERPVGGDIAGNAERLARVSDMALHATQMQDAA